MKQKINIITISFIIFSLYSCSPTKYLEKDEYILNKIKIECDNPDFKDYDFEPYLKQKPIRKTFFVALHARLYNIPNPKKDKKREDKNKKRLEKKNKKIENKFDKKTSKILKKKNSYSYAMKKASEHNDSAQYLKYQTKYHDINQTYSNRIASRSEIIKEDLKDEVFTFANWFKKIGEEPEVFDEYLLDKSAEQFKLFLRNKGYYEAEIGYVSKKKFSKKINVFYSVYTGNPLIINNISLRCNDTVLKEIIISDSENFVISEGSLLDIDLLQEERTRITNLLKDEGYYNFSKQYINFEVDTAGNKYEANVLITVDDFLNPQGEKTNHIKYKIGNIYLFSDYNPQLALEFPKNYFLENDTISFLNENSIRYNFIKKEEIIVKPSAIINDIYIFPDSIYNLSNIKATYKHLSSLKIYKLSNIQFEEVDTVNHILECNIQLTPSERQSYRIETQGTNTSGNIGATQNLKYQHKNLFRGGEIFDLKVSATLESNKVFGDTTERKIKFRGFNTQEYSIETGIEFPKLVIPFDVREFIKRNNPKTTINAGFSYQNRPDYVRTIANINYNYEWKNSENLSFSPSIIKLSLIRVPVEKMDSTFINWLINISARESYSDQLIIGSSFSLTFSNQKTAKRNFIYLKLNSNWAGNSLYGLTNLTQNLNWTDLRIDQNGSYYLPYINIAFAQFFKTDLDFRYYNILDKNNIVVYRVFTGIGLPYGNSTLLPFSEKYFTGGANGIRAWNVRSLGPGTYQMPENIKIPNQSSDIKIEANVEYRFKLFWILEGALFLDAGNIWAINEYDTRNGAQFHFNSFYKEIAIGTGFGARLDINFFVFRVDIGMKLKDPTLPENDRWIIYNREYDISNDFTLNIGIGYPF